MREGTHVFDGAKVRGGRDRSGRVRSGRIRGGQARGGRLVARLLAMSLAVGALTLGAPGTQQADAFSACTGRPAKTVSFTGGELRIYRSRHYACAIALAKAPGLRRYMSVQLQPRGGRAAVDAGRFTRQAGPVTVHALNRCVRATGNVGGRTASTGWILC